MWFFAASIDLSDSAFARGMLVSATSLMVLASVIFSLVTLRYDYIRTKVLRDAEEHWHGFISECEMCSSVITSYLQTESIVVSVDEAHAHMNKTDASTVDS